MGHNIAVSHFLQEFSPFSEISRISMRIYSERLFPRFLTTFLIFYLHPELYDSLGASIRISIFFLDGGERSVKLVCASSNIKGFSGSLQFNSCMK